MPSVLHSSALEACSSVVYSPHTSNTVYMLISNNTAKLYSHSPSHLDPGCKYPKGGAVMSQSGVKTVIGLQNYLDSLTHSCTE